MNPIRAIKSELSDTVRHFRDLYNIARKSGIKDAWDYDRMFTEIRHPELGVYNFKKDVNPVHNLGIVRERVLHRDGKYSLTQTEVVPLKEALSLGLISQGNYDAVIVAHTK